MEDNKICIWPYIKCQRTTQHCWWWFCWSRCGWFWCKRGILHFWMDQGDPHRSRDWGARLRWSLFISCRAIIEVVHKKFRGSKNWMKICAKYQHKIRKYLLWKTFTTENEYIWKEKIKRDELFSDQKWILWFYLWRNLQSWFNRTWIISGIRGFQKLRQWRWG